MSSPLRRLTRCAVLTALALALSVAEGLVPLTILFPLPGLRLGLANLVTTYALCRLSGREALLILVSRCLLGALLGGNLMALAFSLTGGLLALAVLLDGRVSDALGGMLCGVGSGLLAMSGSTLLNLRHEAKHPEMARRHDIEQKDERNVAIRNRAKAVSGEALQWSIMAAAWLSIGLDAPLWVPLAATGVFVAKSVLELYLIVRYQREM